MSFGIKAVFWGRIDGNIAVRQFLLAGLLRFDR
jgi:hypothetical protein